VHDHSHYKGGDKRLVGAVLVNILLTIAQVVGGVLSGSLSLVADALHNLSDAAALRVALVARRIGRQPADAKRTFGYRRAVQYCVRHILP
jgi:cobalt-zinc-cadmium efflux system protein